MACLEETKAVLCRFFFVSIPNVNLIGKICHLLGKKAVKVIKSYGNQLLEGQN